MARIPVHHRPLSAVLSIAAVLAACDAQVSPGYRGEALLVMKGSVEVTGATTEGQLHPALAFTNDELGEIDIVEVEVDGQFPAEFTLRVYDPPPARALMRLTQEASAPRVALAYLTAVTDKHPSQLQFPTEGTGMTAGCGPDGGCGDQPYVREQETLCTHDRQTCYTETVTCPSPTAPDDQCTTTHTGDASLKESPWKSFAGLSQNYEIVYAEDHVPRGSATLLALGSDDELDAGYNLMSIRPATLDEQLEQQHCAEAAAEDARVRFNQKHGTDYDNLQIWGNTCNVAAPPPGASPPAQPDPACKPPASEAEVAEYFATIAQVKIEQGCYETAVRATRVADAAHEPISVVISPGLSPAGRQQPSEQMPVSPAMSP